MRSHSFPDFLLYTLAAAGWAVAARPLPAQTISFIRQFNAPAMERGAGVAADASGAYVIANKPPARPGGQYQAGVRKYDSAGNELWTRDFSVPVAGGAQLIGAAADGGVYVIGYFRFVQNGGPATTAFVRKYSGGGEELWTRQLGSGPLGGVAADPTGVYLAESGSSLLHKYSVDGDELWSSRSGDLAMAIGVTVDATGVYVLVGGANFLVRKWDARGNELWTRDLGAAADRASNPELIAAAAPTGFLVAGGNGGSTFLRRYDADGNKLWSRSVATSYANLYLAGVAADGTGVYVAGFTPLTGLVGQCRSGAGGDSFVRKFDPDGTELWTREFGTPDAAWASGVAVDAGGVYVAGTVGTPQLEDGLYFRILPTPDPASGVFLTKFEKSATVNTESGPRIFPDCVVNAASYVGGGVAPGEMVSIFGSALGPGGESNLPPSQSGTRVLFEGVPARLLYVSDKQITAIVPEDVAGRASVDVQVEYQGVRSDTMNLPVLASRPGIFSLDGSGQGQGAIRNEDGTFNSPSNPARAGSIITMYATGGGEILPVSAFFDITPSPLGEGEITPIQGQVVNAGEVSGSVAGLLEIKLRVPAKATVTGDAVPFALVIGDQWEAFQVTFALR